MTLILTSKMFDVMGVWNPRVAAGRISYGSRFLVFCVVHRQFATRTVC